MTKPSLREQIESWRDEAARHATECERYRDYERRDVLRAQVSAYVKVLALLPADETPQVETFIRTVRERAVNLQRRYKLSSAAALQEAFQVSVDNLPATPEASRRPAEYTREEFERDRMGETGDRLAEASRRPECGCDKPNQPRRDICGSNRCICRCHAEMQKERCR